jgi:hypothetical protein
MKKIFKWAGYALLFLSIILFAVFLQWESISYFTLRKVTQFYAHRAGINFDIGRIRGKPFSETTIEKLAIRPEEGQPQAYHFKSQSITCSYNLWDLRKGYESFLQGLSCSAQIPEFFQDLSVSITQDEVASEFHTLLLPAVLPRIDINSGIVNLSHTGWDVEIRQIRGVLQSSSAAHELLLDVGSFSIRQQGDTKINTSFTSKLRYSGTKLSIDSFRTGNDEILATGSIDLARIDEKNIGFEADLAFAESLLNVAGSLDKNVLKAQISTQNFDIGELQNRLGGTGWEVSGNIKAEADLAVNLATPEQLDGSFSLSVLDGKMRGVMVERVAAAGSFDNRNLRISSAEFRAPGNHIRVKDVTAPMPLLLEGEILPVLGRSQAEFSADVTDVETLRQLFRISDEILPAPGSPESMNVSGHMSDGILFLEQARAAAVDLSLTIDRATIPIPATKEKFESVAIDLAAHIESSSLQKIAGLFGDIAVDGQAAADLTIAGSIRNPQARINLSGEYLSFKGMQLGELKLQGDIRLFQESLGGKKSLEFGISEMTQENGTGILTLLSPVTGTWKDDTFSMSGTFKLDGKGEIAAAVSRAAGKEIAVEISTRGLDSDGWLGNYIDSRYFFHGADTEAVLSGVFENTQLQLSGSIREAGATDVDFPLTGSFNLRYSSKGIEIAEFTWKSMERNQLTVSGFLPYDPMADEPFLKGELSLAGYIDFPSLEDVAVFLEPWGIDKGSLDLDMELTGSWKQPLGHVLLQVENLEPPDRMRKFIESPLDISVDITVQDDTIVLKSGSLESTQYAVQATGIWQHDISFEELMRKGKGELQGEVIGNAAVQLKDMNFLRRNLPWLRRLEGDMRGEVHVSGPISKPILKGSFSLKDGEASHTFNFPMLSAVNLQGIFDENFITISEMQAEVGGSPVSLNGKINLEEKAVNVNLHVDGRNVLLFRNNDMLMRGDVQLDVTGPLDRLRIKGTTGLTGGYYTRSIDFLSMIGSSSTPVSEGVNSLFSFQDPPLNKAVLDIRITTVEPFRIRTRLIRGVLRPELSLKGTGELPFLVGTVYIDPTRVLLPSGRLQVQSGLLRFLEGRPDRPELDLIAQSKLLGYDINVITRGPLDDLVITLSSSPALPNEDLMLLLLTGQPPKDDIAAGAQSKVSNNVIVYLGRDFLGKWLEDENGTGDETILDRFELDFGRDVTKSGDQTVESSFRLSKQTTGKGRMYYLTGEKDKYDAYNYGLKLVFHFE